MRVQVEFRAMLILQLSGSRLAREKEDNRIPTVPTKTENETAPDSGVCRAAWFCAWRAGLSRSSLRRRPSVCHCLHVHSTSRQLPCPHTSECALWSNNRREPDTFKFLRHVMRAILSARPKCSHRCVSQQETPLKRVEILTHATRRSTEQTSMRAKWFKQIAI